jgi:imidazolonepropionase-like amidohydrolase
LGNTAVLQAATRDAARVLLGRDDLGTLEAGKLADIIIVDGDPIANIDTLSNVKVVIKNGEVMLEKP